MLIDSLGSGGAQRQFLLLINGLLDRGHNITLVTYYNSVHFDDQVGNSVNLQRVRLDKSIIGNFGIIGSVYKLLKFNGFDGMLSFLDTPNFYNAFINLFIKDTCHNVVSYRNSTSLGFNLYSISKLFTHFFSDRRIANSRNESNYWNQLIKFNNVELIVNGIDDSQFYFANKPTYKSYRTLSIGSVTSKKNVEFAIHSLALLRDKYKTVVTHTWIGNRYDFNGNLTDYAIYLEGLLVKLDLGDQWIWVDPIKNVHEIYNQYDCLILCSKREGIPNVILESMLSGVPVLAIDNCDSPELLGDNTRGILFGPEYNDLAEKITRFYKLKDMEIAQMCIMAEAYVKKRFSLQKMIDSYEGLFFI